jgi:hypothetical protein
MTLYFFNVCDNISLYGDYRGMDLPDLAMALVEARKIAAFVVGGLLQQPSLFANLQVHICDGAGNILERVAMPDTAGFPR